MIAAVRAAAYPLPRRPSPGAESLRQRLERSALAISWISMAPPVSAFGSLLVLLGNQPFRKTWRFDGILTDRPDGPLWTGQLLDACRGRPKWCPPTLI